MRTINFKVIPSAQILRRDIECLRITSYKGREELEVKVCPSGFPGIVFNIASDTSSAIESIATRTAKTSNIPRLFMHGQGSEPSVMRFKNVPYISIQVVFKSHALYTLFGMDASSFNQDFLLPEQFGATELEMRLLAANTTAEQVSILGEFLISKLEQTRGFSKKYTIDLRKDLKIKWALDIMKCYWVKLKFNRIYNYFLRRGNMYLSNT
jgi:hypothetical protein